MYSDSFGKLAGVQRKKYTSVINELNEVVGSLNQLYNELTQLKKISTNIIKIDNQTLNEKEINNMIEVVNDVRSNITNYIVPEIQRRINDL